MIIKSSSSIYFNSRLFRGSKNVLYFHQRINNKTSITSRTPSTLKEEHINRWVAKLGLKERQLLLNALQNNTNQTLAPESQPISPTDAADTVNTVSTKELIYVGFYYSLPFIGFGFLDNFIMICAGDYIELTIGAGIGISTMAAAGLGNAVSDVAGVGSAWYVESLVRRLGIPVPELSPAQFASRPTSWAMNIGRASGVALGCILGMIPLLWRKSKNNNVKESVD